MIWYNIINNAIISSMTYDISIIVFMISVITRSLVGSSARPPARSDWRSARPPKGIPRGRAGLAVASHVTSNCLHFSICACHP